MYAHVITNNHIRPLCSWRDLPAREREQFDYIGEDNWADRFVQYRGSWYDVNDAQRITVGGSDYDPGNINVHPDHPLTAWDGIATESHWTGVVFRFPTDDEVFRYDLSSGRWAYIIVGRYVA